METAAALLADCRDCGAPLPAAARYCPACGQSTRRQPLTVPAFVQEYSHQ